MKQFKHDLILNFCKNKKILHIGSADSPYHLERFNNGTLLHLKLQKNCKEVVGIDISCDTCHSHFEGDEHFSVNSNACFTCHFTENPEDGHRPVKTDCRDCHEVPERVIKRGLVEINHAEFVSYNVNCEDSCHKKEIRIASNVSDDVCLNCHSFSKSNSAELDKEELHHVHSTGEKVECFACHGKIDHMSKKSPSVSSMINCVNCHSDTHDTQLSTYTAKQHADYDRRHVLRWSVRAVQSPPHLFHGYER